jgi:hypothetical protein
VGGNLTVAGAAAWTTDPAAVENYENFTVTITGFNLSAADKYAVVNARTSLSGCDQPSNPAYVSDAAVDGLSVGIPGLLALPAGVYLICYNTGGISYLDSAAPYVAVGPPLRVQGVEFFSSDPTPPTDDAPFTVTFHGLGLNTTDRYQVVLGLGWALMWESAAFRGGGSGGETLCWVGGRAIRDPQMQHVEGGGLETVFSCR